MQKYRKWTDQATGINPYVQVQPIGPNIFIRILLFILGLLKCALWIPLRYIILFCAAISFLMVPSLPILSQPLRIVRKYLIQIPTNLLLYLLSVYKCDDFGFKKAVEKAEKKGGTLILSNGVSVIDALYYIAKVSPVKFIVVKKQKDGLDYRTLGIMGLLYRVSMCKQPFFEVQDKVPSIEKNKKIVSLEQLIQAQTSKSNQNLVLFYQGVRTNGLGTVKPSRELCESIYKIERDFLLCHLKVWSGGHFQINSMATHPLILLFRCMMSPYVGLRARGKQVEAKDINSTNGVMAEITDFARMSNSKMLEAEPEGYFEFLKYHQENKHK